MKYRIIEYANGVFAIQVKRLGLFWDNYLEPFVWVEKQGLKLSDLMHPTTYRTLKDAEDKISILKSLKTKYNGHWIDHLRGYYVCTSINFKQASEWFYPVFGGTLHSVTREIDSRIWKANKEKADRKLNTKVIKIYNQK